ncbi:hypothetical protein [Klebsiella pneumoniae]
MTKSTITRERLQEIAEDGFLKHGESKELARIALAAMDSEPVKRVNADQMHHVCLEANRHLDKYGAMAKEVNKLLGRIPAQPAPVVPDFKKLASELVDNLVDCGGLDEGVKEKYLEWAEKTCRAAMLQTKSLTSINPAPDLVSLQKKAESIIGNYPGIPDCWCRTCRPVVLNDMRFVVCPDCGNKRCPRANDHKNACTGSNEPGQEGSAYPDTLHESKP